MRKPIIGVTVGTPMSPSRVGATLNPVRTVNGVAPDENGNVNVSGTGGVDKEEIVQLVLESLTTWTGGVY